MSEALQAAVKAVEVLERAVKVAQEKHDQAVRLSEQNSLLRVNIATLNSMVEDEQTHYTVMRGYFEAEIAKLKAENDALGNTIADLICELIELKN